MKCRHAVRIRLSFVALAFALAIWPAVGVAGSNSDAAWQSILELESQPPTKNFSSREEARRVVLERLRIQEGALRRFVRKFPLDDRVTDAQLRLARVLAVQSDLLPDPAKFTESMAVLDALEKGPGQSRERLADIAFARLGLQMARIQRRDAESRELLTRSLRELQAEYAGDRRIPPLIVEVSSFYDAEPKAKAKGA